MVGIIIQARMASSRFPGKIIASLPEPNGKAVLAHIVARCKAVQGIDKIIVATTDTGDDDNLPEWLADNCPDAVCFRGSEQNVLQRFLDAAGLHQLTHVIRSTADNPCIDPSIISSALKDHLSSNADYTITSGYPTGMNVEIFRTEALKAAAMESLSTEEKEHVTLCFRNRPSTFKTNTITGESDAYQRLRLTLDTNLDYLQLCAVFDQLYTENQLFGLKEIIALKNARPWIFKINEASFQKRQGLSEAEELNFAKEILLKMELFKAAEKFD